MRDIGKGLGLFAGGAMIGHSLPSHDIIGLVCGVAAICATLMVCYSHRTVHSGQAGHTGFVIEREGDVK